MKEIDGLNVHTEKIHAMLPLEILQHNLLPSSVPSSALHSTSSLLVASNILYACVLFTRMAVFSGCAIFDIFEKVENLSLLFETARNAALRHPCLTPRGVLIPSPACFETGEHKDSLPSYLFRSTFNAHLLICILGTRMPIHQATPHHQHGDPPMTIG